jgi:hypothetical protein
MSSCIKGLASAWVQTLRWTRMLDDKDSVMANAIETLNQSILQIKGQEAALMREMADLAVQIKSRDRSMLKSTLKPLLMRSKQRRMKLTQLVRKRESFEQHLEVIYNSELDQTLISAVKTTASAMKNLGLDKKLSDVDDIMTDLEETHSDVKDINNALSQKMVHEDDFDEDDLEEELSILLGIDSSNAQDDDSGLLRSKLLVKSRRAGPAVPDVSAVSAVSDVPDIPKTSNSMTQSEVETVPSREPENDADREPLLELPLPVKDA